MKNCFYPLFISLSVFVGSAISPATIFAQDDCVCAICGRPCNDIPTLGHIPGYSCYVETKSNQGNSNQGSSANVPTGGSQSMDQMIATTIMQSLLNSIFSPPAPSPGKSPAQLKLEQEQRDKEIQKRMMQWNADRDRIAAQLMGRPAATGQLDLKPVPSAPVHRPGNSAWEQLNASSWLSGKAGEAAIEGDLVEASFLSDQAFQAAIGAPLLVKVPSAPPQPASFSSPDNAQVYKGFIIAINEQTKKVVDANREVKGAAEKRKQAEITVAENEKRVEETKRQSPADSAQSDPDMIAALQALEQSKQNLLDAEQGLEKAQQREEQEKKLSTELINMNTRALDDPAYASQFGKFNQ